MSEPSSPVPGASAQPLDSQAYELAYDLLAAALDRVGPAEETALLARLCLLLIDCAPDLATVAAAIAAAEQASPASAVRPGDT